MDVSENLAPKFHSEVKAMSLTPLPPPPRKVCLWLIFFALLATNGPLPAELKFKIFQNTKNLTKLKGGGGTHNVGASWETFMNSRKMEHPKKHASVATTPDKTVETLSSIL